MLSRTRDFSTGQESDSQGLNITPPTRDATNRKNLILLIQLRWIAVVGQIVTIAVVQFIFRIALPLAPMLVLLAALVTLNLTSIAWLRTHMEVSIRGLFMVLLLDVAALTAQLCLSGGATNPFTFLYLLQVTLGAVLLNARATWALVGVTCVCFLGLTQFYRPLAIPHQEAATILYMQIAGMLVCFTLDAALLVVFATRMMRNLRERDARLAALKQHAIEEDHIVRMGLLASGAAHELGTPLASLSVILNDWRRMESLSVFPEMLKEIEEMQAAVQRCKTIVTGVLQSAGEARGESPRVTTVYTFLDDLVEDWRVTHPAATLQYERAFGTDLPIVSDSALKQVICNVLDNAYEVSPDWLSFVTERDGDRLVLQVSDKGPGFAAEMLARFGKPYQSTKGRQGGGLGLFLVVNVVRKLGGSVSARNRPEGGATVTLDLPLDTLIMKADNHGH